MTRVHVVMYSVLLLICCASSQAQQTMPTNTNAVVPPLINFSGVLADGNGKPLISVTGVTFLLYKEQQGGAPLWMETRNVAPDNNGGYSVMLGSTSNTGLPGDIFVAGAARWLAVQPQGQQEYPRVLLLSVPYALKAADAQTLGGLPASAFLLAAPSNNGAGTSTDGSGTNPAVAPPSGSENVTTTGGTVSFLPLWDSTSDIISSTIFQAGSGSTAKIGIGTTTPSSTLDVKGGATVRGLLYLPISGTATATAGKDSQALDLAASAFDSSTGAAVSQTFQWRAEPEGNNTSNPAGTLNLLFGSGAATPSETGLNIARNGKITFATGQTFPGLGTITGVTAGTDLTGGGTTGAVTLNVDTTKIPQLTTANTFTGNQTVNGTLTASAFSGNGSALTNVSAADALKFAGLPSNAYAQLGRVNTFSQNQTVNGTLTASSSVGTIVANSTALGAAAMQGNGSFNGVLGLATATTGTTYGVAGEAESTTGYGVAGFAFATTGNPIGVYGSSVAPNGVGVSGTSPYVAVEGYVPNSSGDSYAVYGLNGSLNGYGVYGLSSYVGMYGAASDSSQEGQVQGLGRAGVWGDTGSTSSGYVGVLGTADNNIAGYFASDGGYPTMFVANSDVNADEVFQAYMSSVQTYATIGNPGCNIGFIALQLGQDTMSECNNYTMAGGTNGDTYVNASSGSAVHIRINSVEQLVATSGNVDVLGTLSKGGGSFKIDHPLDPANKYLYHSFVESPDMMNIYNGNVTTDANGDAAVELPEWFEILNRDFRYQLTVIGQFAQAIVAGKVANHQFVIKTDKPNVEVSWQVTGIRQDAFANTHRIQVEAEKAPADRGHYLYPELVGAPETARIGYMAPAPKGKPIVHTRLPFPKPGNASPLQRRPASILAPPMPVAPAGKLAVNPK